MDDKTKLEPAFPCPGGHIECYHPIGMTLLDYFAGQVISTVLIQEINPDAVPQRVAKTAYEIAEAMLKEKAKYQAAHS